MMYRVCVLILTYSDYAPHAAMSSSIRSSALIPVPFRRVLRAILKEVQHCEGISPAGVVAMEASAPANPPIAMTCQSFRSLAGAPKALPAHHSASYKRAVPALL